MCKLPGEIARSPAGCATTGCTAWRFFRLGWFSLIALGQLRKAQQAIHRIEATVAADNVSQLRSGERIRVAAAVNFLQLICRQTVTTPGVKDHLAQFEYQITIRSQIFDLM